MDNMRDYLQKKLAYVHDINSVSQHRKKKGKVYDPINWNTPHMDAAFPVIKNYCYMVLAGETKSGKSTVAFDLAVKNVQQGKEILYITLEMTKDQLIDNIARAYAGIEPLEEREYLQTGVYPNGKDSPFKRKQDELQNYNTLHIYGKRLGETLTIDSILNIILKHKDADLVIIDNLDKIDNKPKQDDFQKQKDVSNTLLHFTNEYLYPVILIHHFKKAPEGPKGTFRSTDALSGTGKLSHDANMVVYVAREKNDEGEFNSAQTFIRVMETREFSPCIRRVFFHKGVFQDENPFDLLFT